MSVFITCDGTVSVTSNAAPSCSGSWATIESADVLQAASTLSQSDWRYVWEGCIWVFVAAGAIIALMRLIRVMTHQGVSSDET